MNMNKYTKILLLAFTANLLFANCSDDSNIQTYDNNQKRGLYFNRYIDETSDILVRSDTAVISLNEYPGVKEVTHNFKLSLIGIPFREDKKYIAYVDEYRSTAYPNQYSIPTNPIFKKNQVSDSLKVTIYSENVKDKEEVFIVIGLKSNNNFDLGFEEGKFVKLIFNKIIQKPRWWNYKMTKIYLGEYSYEKYEAFVIANGGYVKIDKNTTDMEKRKMALKLKKYIQKNNIKEKDGSPMIVPAY